jgi:drug/metabolite transporter (DMT)-like permease
MSKFPKTPIEPPDPVAEHRDWINHRYTPGYFVGGRISPVVRAVWSGDSPGLGVFFLLAGCLGVAGACVIGWRWSRGARDEVLVEALQVGAGSLFMVAFGFFMFRRFRRRASATPVSPRRRR